MMTSLSNAKFLPAPFQRFNKMNTNFESLYDAEELKIFFSLDSPVKIQAFLDAISYSTDETYRCPRSVLRDRKAHCFDGALFAAAALRHLGYPPLISEMLAERDDSHILALYKRDGCWGAVAKSNFVGLRFREAVYRSLRELVMSYFEFYYNVNYEKTLRGYTIPLNLKIFDNFRWVVSDDNLEIIAQALDKTRRISLLSKSRLSFLSPVDERSYLAGMLGTDQAGLYNPDP
jgi:hypothetical protein